VTRSETFRALIVRTSYPTSGAHLHLIRDGTPSSLCGIPRENLIAGGILEVVMCTACMFAVQRDIEHNFPPTPD